MKVPVGFSDFKDLREQKCDFVDKTLLIQEILEDTTKAFLIARPRRFGKTLNMSMLRYFFDIRAAQENRVLFEDTLIANARLKDGRACMDFQGKFPVIFVTLKDVRASNCEELYKEIANTMSELYMEHAYLLAADSNVLNEREKTIYQNIKEEKASKQHLKASLKKLTQYLYRFYGQQVIVLMDEYDTPMHSAFEAKPSYHDQLLPFMGTFMSAVFKDNVHLHQGILTGILRVSLMNLFSGVNSLPVHNMCSERYARYFGFTESEVDGLLEKADFAYNKEAIQQWYNGYKINGLTLYNPWSIINCLYRYGQLQPYWLESGEHGVLGKALLSLLDQTIFEQLKALLDEKAVEVEFNERTLFTDVERDPDALWNVMFYSGYLKAIGMRLYDDETYIQLAIPNREVRSIFKKIIKDWGRLPGYGASIYKALVTSLSTGDVEQFKEIVQRYLEETASFYDFERRTEEKFYHIFLLGMFVTLRDQFIVDSNKEAGLGRFDIILIPKPDTKIKQGVIMELKSLARTDKKGKKSKKRKYIELSDGESELKASAQNALDQIDTQRYQAKFTQHDIFQAVHIGLSFYGKRVAVNYKCVEYGSALQPAVKLVSSSSLFFESKDENSESALSKKTDVSYTV